MFHGIETHAGIVAFVLCCILSLLGGGKVGIGLSHRHGCPLADYGLIPIFRNKCSSPTGEIHLDEIISRKGGSKLPIWHLSIRQSLKSLIDIDNLPEPDVLAEEIIENLEAGLSSFREVLAGLEKGA